MDFSVCLFGPGRAARMLVTGEPLFGSRSHDSSVDDQCDSVITLAYLVLAYGQSGIRTSLEQLTVVQSTDAYS